jgi:trigger factor
MATITQENIGNLHKRISVKLEKSDYLPSFEKALKDYSKKANIPGFRKGMVPAGLIKKMYGASLFTDEVLKSVDRELIGYLQTEKFDIFAQPLPLETDLHQLDVNNPIDYTFHFEVGMKPDFQLPDLASAAITRYEVIVTDEMIDNEITRLQNRYGNMKDEETVTTEENVLNVNFAETDKEGNPVETAENEKAKKDNSLLVKYFSEPVRSQWMGKKAGDFLVLDLKTAFDPKEREWIISDLALGETENAADKTYRITITKIGLLEKRELNEEFFNQLYAGQDVKTIEDFRIKIREEIQAYWRAQANQQIQDQVYHELIDHTGISFPEEFLKKWMQQQGDLKTEDSLEKEFPRFLNQLKWTVITDKIVRDNAIEVSADELRAFAKQQLFSYMGNANLSDDQPWVNDYVERMMKDKKYVEDAYNRIQSQKVLEWAATQVRPAAQEISADDFTSMIEEHRHHHH